MQLKTESMRYNISDEKIINAVDSSYDNVKSDFDDQGQQDNIKTEKKDSLTYSINVDNIVIAEN